MNRAIRILLAAALAILLALGAFATAETAGDLYTADGEQLVILDRDGVRIYLTGDVGNSSNTVPLNCVVENNTDQKLDILYSGAANGWDMGYNTHLVNNGLDAGIKAKASITLWPEKVEVTKFEELETLKLTLEVRDEAGKTLFTEKTGTIHFHTTAEQAAPAAEQTGTAEASESEYADDTAAQAVDLISDIAANLTADDSGSEAAKPDEAPTEPARVYTTLDVGSKGDDVVELQQALIDQGFLSGKADGAYGKGTAGSVKKFQESVGLPATGVADEATQRKLYHDELPPVEIKLSGVFDTDYMTVNGIFTDASYVDDKNPELTRLYLFYTAKTPGDSYKVDSKDSKLTFSNGGTYTSSHHWAACLYMSSYYYRDFLKDVYVGDGVRVAETFYVPKAEIVPGRTITFSSSQIADSDRISLATDDIITLGSAREIAQIIDPEGYAQQSYALTEADKATKNKVLKAVNNYYWDFWVDQITYRIEFGKYKYDQVSKINGTRIPTKGTYTICNGYLILENGGTHTLIYVPYTWNGNDINLDIANAFDWRSN